MLTAGSSSLLVRRQACQIRGHLHVSLLFPQQSTMAQMLSCQFFGLILHDLQTLVSIVLGKTRLLHFASDLEVMQASVCSVWLNVDAQLQLEVGP